MKKSFSFSLLALILFQSCVIYHKSPVPINQAHDKGRVKVTTIHGNNLDYKNIELKDSIYFGVLTDRKVPLPPEQIKSIYLEDINKPVKNILSTQLLGDFYGGMGLKYERIVFQKNVVQLIPRIGLGLHILEKVAPIYSVGGSVALGRNYSKFELGASYLFLISNNALDGIPIFNLAYRNQKPVGKFFFSLGLHYSLEAPLFKLYPSGSIGLSY